tara:strand:- start:156 stop:332 length:177 start_codon:yes stop_codon:yes gene_type:complete
MSFFFFFVFIVKIVIQKSTKIVKLCVKLLKALCKDSKVTKLSKALESVNLIVQLSKTL